LNPFSALNHINFSLFLQAFPDPSQFHHGSNINIANENQWQHYPQKSSNNGMTFSNQQSFQVSLVFQIVSKTYFVS
jgi:hypothetical protein